MGDRERERAENDSPLLNGSAYPESMPPSPSLEDASIQRNIDLLFDRHQESSWEPASAPEALGELMDSRYMLPLVLPSDPRVLGAVPVKTAAVLQGRARSDSVALDMPRSSSRASNRTRTSLGWRLRSRKVREVEIRTLQWIDGAPSTARWYRQAEFEDEDEKPAVDTPSNDDPSTNGARLSLHLTPLTNSRLPRTRGRQSTGATPIEADRSDPISQQAVAPPQ